LKKKYFSSDFNLFVTLVREDGHTYTQELWTTDETLHQEKTETFSLEVFIQMRGIESVGSSLSKTSEGTRVLLPS